MTPVKTSGSASGSSQSRAFSTNSVSSSSAFSGVQRDLRTAEPALLVRCKRALDLFEHRCLQIGGETGVEELGRDAHGLRQRAVRLLAARSALGSLDQARL